MSEQATLIGHNQGPPLEPSDLETALHPAVIRDQLALDYADLVARWQELQDAGDRFFETMRVIETDDDYARAVAFAVQVADSARDLEAARVKERGVFAAAADAVQRFFKADHIDAADKLRKDVLAKATVFALEKDKAARAAAQAEAARLAEEAARKAAEAETSLRPSALEDAAAAADAADAAARKAEAKPAEFSRTRAVGATGSLSRRYKAEIVDPALVPRVYLEVSQRKLDFAVSQGLRDGEDGTPAIPGVRIVEISNVRARRS